MRPRASMLSGSSVARGSHSRTILHVASASSSPIGASWDTTQIADGSHLLTCKARDAAEKDLKDIMWKQSEIAAVAAKASQAAAPAERSTVLEKFLAAHIVLPAEQTDADDGDFPKEHGLKIADGG